jgi:hypothetical protein
MSLTRGYTNVHYNEAFSFTLTKVYTYKEKKKLLATASLANGTILNLVYVRKNVSLYGSDFKKF